MPTPPSGGNDRPTTTDRTPVQSEQQVESARRLSLQSSSVPTNLPGYELVKTIGEGSFGTVWLGREKKTGRQVAIKFFSNRRGLDWPLLTREVEKLAVLDSSRDVVRLLDVGWDHDPPYFVMEYLPQQSVAALLELGPVSIPQAIEITRAVCRALVHAHNAGILHCDIKPGNVLLDRGGEARLADFGQSRLSSDQSPALGTFYYMAPEQASLHAVPDVRWDVYAVGALLYHMVTGTPPYRTDETETRLQAAATLPQRLETYQQVIEESPPPDEHRNVSGIDRALVELIDDCLEPDPSLRTPNPQAILDRLEQREVNRTRRPLIWLGFLGPTLLLLVLFWIGSSAVPEAVRQAETHLFQRALASDMATAHLLADGIQRELDDRQSELERLTQWILPPEGARSDYHGFREDLIPMLDEWKQRVDRRFRRQRRTLDESFFVVDREGIHIYRDPWGDTIGRSFSFRDYFHGQGRDLIPGRDDVTGIKPRQEPGISSAFRSTVTNQFMVAIAVPVWNREGTEVIGVLARTLHLADLLNQWEERINVRRNEKSPLPDNDRFIALVDMRERRPYLLDHHWMTPERLRALGDDSRLKPLLELTPEEELILRKAVRERTGIADYRDPLADVDEFYEGAWLAAVAPVEGIDWIALVQERRSLAVAPMAELYWMFLRYGLVMLIVVATMLSLLWWLIQRIMRV
jgi:eukaryotic-like serine/threonine-protein kinase